MPHSSRNAWRLGLTKSVHTLAWAFFVACIASIYVFAWRGETAHAAIGIAIVMVEVAALALNGWSCPLSPIAARYTDDRRANFDIYLPAWLAGHTMAIFGPLYIGAIVVTLVRWLQG
jgi:hypothetical protein